MFTFSSAYFGFKSQVSSANSMPLCTSNNSCTQCEWEEDYISPSPTKVNLRRLLLQVQNWHVPFHDFLNRQDNDVVCLQPDVKRIPNAQNQPGKSTHLTPLKNTMEFYFQPGIQ